MKMMIQMRTIPRSPTTTVEYTRTLEIHPHLYARETKIKQLYWFVRILFIFIYKMLFQMRNNAKQKRRKTKRKILQNRLKFMNSFLFFRFYQYFKYETSTKFLSTGKFVLDRLRNSCTFTIYTT